MTKQGKFDPNYAHELLRIAKLDLESAKFLSGQPNSRVENVFLLGQQALEKALKAVLCWKSQAIPFIHEIGVLVAKIEALGFSPPFGYDLNILSEFATIRRYLEGKETWAKTEIDGVLDKIDEAIVWCHDQLAQ